MDISGNPIKGSSLSKASTGSWQRNVIDSNPRCVEEGFEGTDNIPWRCPRLRWESNI